MGIATELNLSLTPGVASRLARHPLLTDAKPIRQRVLNTYYDTPDQRLRSERVVVRSGQKGATWLSSVRRAALPASRQGTPREWETVSAPGQLDFSHVDDSSLREWLESLRDDLRPAFTTSFTRSAWVLEPRDGVRIELALDRGWIEAEGRRQPSVRLASNCLPAAWPTFSRPPANCRPSWRCTRRRRASSSAATGCLPSQALQVVKAIARRHRRRHDRDRRLSHDRPGLPQSPAEQREGCLRKRQPGVRPPGSGCHSSPAFRHSRLETTLPEASWPTFDPLWQALARQLGETRNWDVFLAETCRRSSRLSRMPASGSAGELCPSALCESIARSRAAR
jgi:triphosphatase